MKYSTAIKLLKKYLSGKASVDEVMIVDKWYDEADKKHNVGLQEIVNRVEVKERIYRQIDLSINKKHTVIPFYRRALFQAAGAAAAVIIVAGIYILRPQPQALSKATASVKTVYEKNDFAPPVSNKAILTLADGTVINIDSAGNGEFARQGNMHIVKQADGVIAYNGSTDNEVAYNTLNVPKGSKPLKLKLADGSDVWLNVASSITYPTAFTGAERKVIITGEAYFEVAHNAAKPFIIEKENSNLQVRVLGTHFNVNTYDDEAFAKVTLLEGSVNVSYNNKQALLAPGQQAQIFESIIKKADDVNTNEVMAWKNGTFYFDGAGIKTIMRQVENGIM